ncbi:MinD-like ATPase involved in chromosome partitioning or flagellar assembly [Agromyces sp. 3263]|uniref:AAA family ATPase n=1 Tax=Agromyces sp. 3263 TaxID=2817750 RepID=UPI002854A0A5|nr:AAA family ATPase [Agromyces sp. 3263]MDR6905395.1 MinD-like ATPase involved in chromosome partitioning or flagellar assembly [Agromyces sp. 3263]
MTRYLLVSRSAEYETRLRRLLRARLQTVPGEYLTFGPGEVVDRVTDHPRVALLGPLLSFEETSTLTASLAQEHPGIGVIVVREQRSDLEDWVDGIEIHAVLSPEATDATTEALLDRLDSWLTASGRLPATSDDANEVDDLADLESALDLVDLGGNEATESPTDADAVVAVAEVEPSEPDWVLPPIGDTVRTEVIVVAAPKGGQGKTTTAINLAAGLAEVAPNSVVLVDADVQFGDIANALDLAPQYSLVDVANAGHDEVALKALLTHHDDDFFVIAAPPSPELADEITGEALGEFLARLATMFRYVIVDTTPGLGEHALAALEQATDGVFVTNFTVPSLRALRKEFELLVALQLVPANRHVIVNFVEKNTGLVLKDAEAILGARVDVQVPRSLGVVLASNAGVPLIHHDVRDPAAKAIRGVVLRIDPNAVPTRKRIQRKARAK